MFSYQVEAGQEYAGLGPAKEKGVDLEDEETRVMWEGIALGYALGPSPESPIAAVQTLPLNTYTGVPRS